MSPDMAFTIVMFVLVFGVGCLGILQDNDTMHGK